MKKINWENIFAAYVFVFVVAIWIGLTVLFWAGGDKVISIGYFATMLPCIIALWLNLRDLIKLNEK